VNVRRPILIRSVVAYFEPINDSIACVGGLDGITHVHVSSLLRAKGIECVLEGSVMYGVSVSRDKAITMGSLTERNAFS